MSYQRFCALILAMSAICALGCYWIASAASPLEGLLRWPLTLLLALAALGCMRFAWFIGSSYPKKRRATLIALARIQKGRFHSKSLERYCEDPCYRVVAREILSHTSLPSAEQARVFRELVARAREPAFLIFVNPDSEQGISVQCDL